MIWDPGRAQAVPSQLPGWARLEDCDWQARQINQDETKLVSLKKDVNEAATELEPAVYTSANVEEKNRTLLALRTGTSLFPDLTSFIQCLNSYWTVSYGEMIGCDNDLWPLNLNWCENLFSEQNFRDWVVSLLSPSWRTSTSRWSISQTRPGSRSWTSDALMRLVEAPVETTPVLEVCLVYIQTDLLA